MTREEIYTAQMRQLGIYHAAFDPAIHTLAIMEREQQRLLKRWKASGSSETSPLYTVITQQRRDILRYREALGLTPRGLERIRGETPRSDETTRRAETALDVVLRNRRSE